MASPSKNSRASRGTANNRPVNQGTFTLLTPVGGGTGAYVFNPENGTNPRLATSSPAFVAAIADLAGKGHAAKLTEELDQLHASYPGNGWDATLARLKDAGAL